MNVLKLLDILPKNTTIVNKRMEKKMIDISQEDFGTLCICALRYCHGRRSYMPSLIQEIVGRHLKEFSDNTINVMVNDCQFQQDMNLYGDECNKIDWLKWEQKVKDEQTIRTIEKRGESYEID